MDLALSISADGNLTRALGYVLVNEGMTPITYSAIKLGMLTYFPELKTQFFDMHITVDEKHVAELYRAIEELPAPRPAFDFLKMLDIITSCIYIQG